jgi:LPS sulfotransferase NodH
VKFIILCYPRTGSTLLITALGAHPEINQGMELFIPEQEGTDQWVHWRRATFEALYGHRNSYLNADGNLDGNRFDLSLLAIEFFKVFNGTKVMYDQLDRRSNVWDYLRSLDDLRVIVLRRNLVEAAVSFRIAIDTNVWFVPNENSYIWYSGTALTPPSPAWTYPLWYFDWFYDHYCSSEQYFVNLFPGNATMVVDYHDMVSHWGQIIPSIQKHFGVDPVEIPMMFDKRTQGKIEELISNYDEIRRHYATHPILASHFKEASESS